MGDASAWMAVGWALSEMPEGTEIFLNEKEWGDFPEHRMMLMNGVDNKDDIFGMEIARTKDWEYQEFKMGDIIKVMQNYMEWVSKNVLLKNFYTPEFKVWIQLTQPKLYFGPYYDY